MRRVHRTRRDWAADLGLLLFAACFAAVTSQSIPVGVEHGAVWRTVDQVVSGLGCAAVLLRRRWPVHLAVALLLVGTQAHYVTGPTVVALFTVAASREWRVTAWVAALAFAPAPFFLPQLSEMSDERVGSGLTYFALCAGSIGWGLFRRSRRQLIASLRERAELAEAQAELRAERALREARAEIAREMHDVLGHRLSLLTVHAGALEFNVGASRAEITRAAGVIRENAHLALRDLREVIGVLRAEPVEGERPQPELADVGRLVAEARTAGGHVELTGPPDGPQPPPAVGRTAYRIVQEALTNARKHAPGAPVTVRVAGGPAGRLEVEVRNAPVPGQAATSGAAPASGTGAGAGSGSGEGAGGGGRGLAGLAERARLVGGELTAGPAGDGFAVRAWLPWPAAEGTAADTGVSRSRHPAGRVEDAAGRG